ncbi:hypothetical protein C8Q79DRAFT_593368 [Trametes meyenii]|nr:hypothetical protein C8Q79DRAFT_593368 [Trametes meyenii]
MNLERDHYQPPPRATTSDAANYVLPSDMPAEQQLEESTYSAEACFHAFQESSNQHWATLGLSMPNSSPPSFAPAAESLATEGSTLVASSRPAAYEVLVQRPYQAKRQFRRRPPIAFQTSSAPYIKLSDALSGDVTHLLDRDENVFTQYHQDLSQKQSLRLEFLHCSPFERQINVRNPAHNSSHSITKGKLAEKIAREIFDYMLRHRAGHMGQLSLNIGPGTRGFERLVLVELRHVSKSSWQPVLGVLPAP